MKIIQILLILGWSKDNNVIYIGNFKFENKIILKNFKIFNIEKITKNEKLEIAKNYGIFGHSRHFTGNNWWNELDKSSTKGWNVFTIPGLGNRLIMSYNGKVKAKFCNDPGWLLKLNHNFTTNGNLLGDKEGIFICNNCLYLIDGEKRIIGKLTAGIRYILINDLYTKISFLP